MLSGRRGRTPLALLLTLVVALGLVGNVAASVGGDAGGGGLTAGPFGLNPTAGLADEGEIPVAISIPDASVDADVEQNDIVDGVMLDPSGPWVVSWYQQSGLIGSLTNVLMSGHVDYWDVGPAIFYTVGDLTEGAQIEVRGEKDTIFTYEVEWVETVEVATLTQEDLNELVGPTDYAALTLVTCGGTFDRERGEYLHRTIVRAKLIDAEGGAFAEREEAEATAEPAESDGTNGADALPEGGFAEGTTVTVTQDGVNLRGGPSTSDEVITVLAAGTTLTVTGEPVEADGYLWYPVETEGGESGWVAADFLEAAE